MGLEPAILHPSATPISAQSPEEVATPSLEINAEMTRH